MQPLGGDTRGHRASAAADMLAGTCWPWAMESGWRMTHSGWRPSRGGAVSPPFSLVSWTTVSLPAQTCSTVWSQLVGVGGKTRRLGRSSNTQGLSRDRTYMAHTGWGRNGNTKKCLTPPLDNLLRIETSLLWVCAEACSAQHCLSVGGDQEKIVRLGAG